MVSKYAKLDVVPGGDPVKFFISENDIRSRTLIFRLFAREGELEIPSGATVTLEAKRPDGAEFEIAGTRNNLELKFILPEAVAEQAGTIPAQVAIKTSDSELRTERILIVVDPGVGGKNV